MKIKLTSSGRREVKRFIAECEEKRKELLDAGKDTAEETNIPTPEDICADIEWFIDAAGHYDNAWGVTDNADLPIHLEKGTDFVETTAEVIYVDMDGVIAEFNTSASVEDTFEEGYFAYCKVDRQAFEFIKSLSFAGYEVKFLTHAYPLPWVQTDKRTFLDRAGLDSYEMICVPYGESKFNFVDMSTNPILIDDFSKNLHEWESAGGVGIKYYNGINGNHGSWTGFAIYRRQKPYALNTTLLGIIAEIRRDRQ